MNRSHVAVRILVAGDAHVPDRADSIHAAILDELDSMKPFDYVLVTGDLINEDTLKQLMGFGRARYVVKGNMDYLELPDKEVIRIGETKIGLMHGHQIMHRGDTRELIRVAVNLRVNILVSGHTHVPMIMKGAITLLNPGSITGAWSGAGNRESPSFLVLELIKGLANIDLYQLIENEIKITKHESISVNLTNIHSLNYFDNMGFRVPND
ncbi:MAG: YfcE family phosphodiesterase [Thermocladium sp.]